MSSADRSDKPEKLVTVPIGHPTSTIFMDESGSRGSGDKFFVMGALKTRTPGKLAREVRNLRENRGFTEEFHFTKMTKGSMDIYMELVDIIVKSDARIGAIVVNKDSYDPFPNQTAHAAHAQVSIEAVKLLLNPGELVTVLMDHITTPRDVFLDENVKSQLNEHFESTSVVSSLCLDSRTSDCVQLADLVASAIAYDVKARLTPRRKGDGGPSGGPKEDVSRRLFSGLEIKNSRDIQKRRATIKTLKEDRLVEFTSVPARLRVKLSLSGDDNTASIDVE